jgi:hypothetical protein
MVPHEKPITDTWAGFCATRGCGGQRCTCDLCTSWRIAHHLKDLCAACVWESLDPLAALAHMLTDE